MTIAHETDYDFETELARNDKVCGIVFAVGLCVLFDSCLALAWSLM